MTSLTAGFMEYEALNKAIRAIEDDQITLEQVQGQRYIGSALSDKELFIKGTAGNALGCFLDGGTITVHGNGQDATGDTMNEGKIIIHGSCGDGTGYAMRGGCIYIRDSSGYRSGIHMKAYQQKQPLLIIGDRAGSFLGEYQAGGTIIVLGRNQEGKPPVGYFCGTGMHGGIMYLRCDTLPVSLPPQVASRDATADDKEILSSLLDEYCTIFSFDKQQLLDSHFFVLQANSATPYRMLYTHV
ncbi:glutamate synthase [Sphaerochaeta globosa]|uniref:Glutamate synthase alpha subunit domain protein n=1 Tax=Sphaerochaeta globosa (strain ATCC BAA-1886 / DSM 22777 / Buddy) TaxID=158189 RepID=F0RXA4_SPHGB|nr:glutamate synthase [Sphaerochaeta globosa]ADY11954.1 glutamate synthase alpha subunit domain protein [Sphaerochaeta globosa str. Buddy]